MSERWKPEILETYFYVGRDFEAYNAIWLEDFPEKTRWKKGNCFRTEAEAKAAAEKVKALLLSLHESTQDTTQDEQLPDWCKVGEWVYLSNKEYDKIESIDGFGINLASRAFINKKYIHEEAVSARLRPYNADELRSLVGKVIEQGDETCVVVHYSRKDGGTIFANGYTHTANELLATGYTIDGKPCGKLEHLENGEWVE